MTAFADTPAIAAPRPWLSFFDFFMRDREAELRSLLAAHEITVMSTRQVEEHVLKLNHLNRPTVWHRLMHIIGYVTALLSLRLPLHFLLRANPVYVGIMALMLAGIGFGATYLFGASSIFALPFAAWSFEAAVMVILILTEGSSRGKHAYKTVVDAVNRWHLYRPGAFFRDTMPLHIQDRLEALEDIPGVRPFILADTNDPVLAAVSGYGPFAKRCYVGAWATGNEQLDAFR